MRLRSVIISVSLGLGMALVPVIAGHATATFNPNDVIEDSVFDNANVYNTDQINNFLNSFSNSCISPNSGFSAIDPTGYNPNSGYQYGDYVTAGQVIHDAAVAYGISPHVLLVTLEKEQSLVSGRNDFSGYCNNGDQHKYAAAVGYGCPDSGTTYSYTGLSLYRRNGVTYTDTGTTCVNSSSKAGFSQQVIRAAWLLKFGEERSEGNVGWAVVKGSWDNSDDPQTCYGGPMTQGTFARCPSGSASYYDGYTTIDGTAVHMDTGATAALYWYTPHFSGNQSFFNLYTSWFGSTRTNATIYTSQFNTTLDPNGAEAKIGFSLSQRPLYPVVIVTTLSNTDVAAFTNSDRITIQPDDWNNPGKNIISVSGKASTLTKAVNLYIKVSQIGSGDNNFSFINPDYIGTPMLVWQPTGGSVYRLFSSSLNKHIFATRQNDIDALIAQGYTLEGAVFNTCNGGETTMVRMRKDGASVLAPQGSSSENSLASQGYSDDGSLFAYAKAAGTVPVYELVKSSNGDYIYTTDSGEAAALVANYGFTNNGVAFNACSSTPQPVFRMFSGAQKEHFYTTSATERDAAANSGFIYEGIAYYTVANSGTPVYRLFSTAKKEHFYTTSSAEKDYAARNGYTYEGIGFYMPDSPTNPVPIYRLYSSATGKHFYTLSASERDAAAQSGYVKEGTAFTTDK